MMIYFDFEDRRRIAEVTWPENTGRIQVILADKELLKKLPSDLLFDMSSQNKISFIEENPDNKRLTRLQKTISNKLQEFANQL